MGIPSDPRSTLVTDCLKANQGKKSHKDVEATIIHHFNTYTSITATKAKPFSDGKQADILLSGITTIDNPAARNWHLDVTSTKTMGVTNQEFINRAGLHHQPGPEEHDPRNDVLTSAKRAEERKHTKYDAICAATGSVSSPFALETTGGHGASTASVYYTCSSKSKCATRGSAGGRAAGQAQEGHLVRATPGHDRPSDYTTCPRRLRLPSARSSAEDEELLALNRRAGGLGS
jgi:hypothetical protein